MADQNSNEYVNCAQQFTARNPMRPGGECRVCDDASRLVCPDSESGHHGFDLLSDPEHEEPVVQCPHCGRVGSISVNW